MKKLQMLMAAMLMSVAASGNAALNAYAALTVGGTSLDGDTTMSEIGGVDVTTDFIEVYQLDHSMASNGNKNTSGPIVLQKRIDQTSPLLIQAMTSNFVVEGDILIFDTNPSTGETRHRFTISISGARIVGVETKLPDAFDASQSTRPPLEYVQIEVGTYTLRDEVNSTESTVGF